MPSAAAARAGISASTSTTSTDSRLNFLQQRVKKAVMLTIRQQLAFWCPVRYLPACREPPGVRMTLQKLRDLLRVFFLENRTRCIQQFAIAGQQRPQSVEQFA